MPWNGLADYMNRDLSGCAIAVYELVHRHGPPGSGFLYDKLGRVVVVRTRDLKPFLGYLRDTGLDDPAHPASSNSILVLADPSNKVAVDLQNGYGLPTGTVFSVYDPLEDQGLTWTKP